MTLYTLNYSIEAQTLPSPKKHYEQNYVQGNNEKPLKHRPTGKEINTNPGAPAIPTTPPTAEESLKNRLQEIREKVRNGNSTAQTTPKPLSNFRLLGVSAVLSTNDEAEFNRTINDLAERIFSTRLKVGTIYLIGQYRPIDPGIRTLFAEREGRVLYERILPEKYRGIKSSPSWILIGEDQEIILEGLGAFSELVDESGKPTITVTARTTPTTTPTAGATP